MGAELRDIDKFNTAREAFIGGDYLNLFSSLDSIQGIDLSLIRREILSSDGNDEYLRNLIESHEEKIVGVFDCPYHPYLALEYSKIQDVFPTIEIDKKFENIRCVKQIESTIGLGNEQVVAIFPENFRSVVAAEEHPVFYFVDKFARRHQKYTRPLLQGFQFEDLFRPLNSLSEEKICEMIANWVNIHEASHRTGEMPIPKFLLEKSNRFSAALEELRADLNTISKCLNPNPVRGCDEYLTGLYVISERLLAYPLFRDKKNFDAISSVIMWKFLNDKDVFKGELVLAKLVESINSLIEFISEIEREAMNEKTVGLRKKKLRDLILDYLGNYDDEFNKYMNFWSLR